MEHSTEVLYNRTKVYCTPAHRFGSDALLLARFCEPKRSQTAADLCSGCGIVALEWHDRGHRGPCAALELQPEGSALLADAVTEQGIGHITPHCADLRTFRLEGRLWVELRGFWDVKNDFMGGPFVSYTTVDTTTQRVFTIDCYVYSPKNHKRNYMRELEHLLYLISVPDKTPADE